jgi:hypothetical protein
LLQLRKPSSRCIGDEVGRDVATVELHTLDHVDVGIGTLGFLNGDDTPSLFTLLHSLGNQLTDLTVVIGGNRHAPHCSILLKSVAYGLATAP